MYIMNLNCLCVNYAFFIRRLCLHVLVRRPLSQSTKRPCDKIWLAAKCPCGEMAGDKVSKRRKGMRRSVPATKRRRRNGGDERGVHEGIHVENVCSIFSPTQLHVSLPACLKQNFY